MASTTLNFANSGNGVKTGTAAADLINNYETLCGTFSANAAFNWEIAGKSVVTPFYLLWRRKNGSAGRIAIMHWSSTPAANNAAILDSTPSTSAVYACYFPNGTGTTLSNLTAAAGTICGNDTDCTKVSYIGAIGTIYAASYVPFYLDTAETLTFGQGNPATTTQFMSYHGEILVNNADVAYGGSMGLAGGSMGSWGGSGAAPIPWLATAPLAGGGLSPAIKTNYGSANRSYYFYGQPGGPWASSPVGSTDILTNTATNDVWFPNIQLLGNTKGEGTALNLRQLGWGPGTVGPYTPYLVLGVQQAIQFCNATTGGNGFPWFTNFKLG